MAAMPIDYEDILLRFDELTARGAINYSPPSTVRLEDDGFLLEFHTSGVLLKKPQLGEALELPKNTLTGDISTKPMCFGPGSDIAYSDPGLLITTVYDTHLLVVNKFCVFRPQLLLLTTDSYRRQSQPLQVDDFRAACNVLFSLKCTHFVISYNCTPTAGGSREHKHLQILPRPTHLFPDDQHFDPNKIPFRYFLRYLGHDMYEGGNAHEMLLRAYNDLVAMAKKALGLLADGQNYCPHNVVFVKEWMIVIPRRNSNFKGVNANAAGMMGSVWLTHESQLDVWRAAGFKQALGHLGIASNSERES